jgi:UPF0716 family protein affecting phage T7 exclusion
MFPELVSDYDSVRRRVETLSGVKMFETPTFEDRNEIYGERPPLRLSVISRALLKVAHAQYRSFASVARARHSTKLRPVLRDGTTRVGEQCCAVTAWRSLWWKPQSVALCGFILYEVLVDSFFSREIGFADLELATVVGAIFGFAVLVRSVRRLDHVERAGNTLSAQEAQRVDLDAVVCIIAAVLIILPGVGGDVVGMTLLLPPIRHMLVTKLAGAMRQQRPLMFGRAR